LKNAKKFRNYYWRNAACLSENKGSKKKFMQGYFKADASVFLSIIQLLHKIVTIS
jgi:hypothetical protein